MSATAVVDWEDDDPPLPPLEPLAGAKVVEALTDEECYLAAILQDASGLDLAEFTWVNEEADDGCWRAWPFQWIWWRTSDQKQISQTARSCGKSESLKARAGVFAFVHPGEEMVLTAPEGIHLDAITDRIEPTLTSTRLFQEMILGGRNGINHRPFKVRYINGARIISRIPQRSGIGLKGTHPVCLEQDECFPGETLVLTSRGQVRIDEVRVGDRVWTHANRWRGITAVMDRGVRSAVSVRGQGHPGLVCTPDHKFYARPCDFTDAKNRWGARPGVTEWVVAKDLDDCMWGSPLAVSGIPAPQVIPPAATGPNNVAIPINRDMLWAFGLWVAEGSLSRASPKSDPNKVTWSVHEAEVPYVLERLRLAGLRPFVQPVQASDKARNVVVGNVELAWILRHEFRCGAANKQIPPWVYGLAKADRRAVLDGVVWGDGFQDRDPRYAPERWKLTTCSKALAISARLLALSLGYSVSLYWNGTRARPAVIRGREIKSNGWYQVVGNAVGQGAVEQGIRWTRIREIVDAGERQMFDLAVEDDHSFVADGIVVSNSQDFPARGWAEIRETLKRDLKGAQWRAHGVSKGLPDDFFKATQPGSGFTVHRYTAMHKPTWTEEERLEKIQEYGSKNDPDYRRNILGVHGDSTNAIFDLSRLMRCVDSNEGSFYNTEDYWFREIRFEMLEDAVARRKLPPEETGRVLAELLDFPSGHHRYDVFWGGMDVGIVRDPSEVLIFAEYAPGAKEMREDRAAGLAVPLEGQTRLKLLTRLKLTRLTTPVQTEALLAVLDFYRPRAFALDATGNGLGILQQLQQTARTSRLMRVEVHDPDSELGEPEKVKGKAKEADAKEALTTIKGYNFGGKVVVEIDEEKAAELPSNVRMEELVEKAGIKRLVKEFATDQCREMVDRQRLRLPFDRNLLEQMNGQTFVYSTEPTDAYGNRRRVYSRGQFHAFDGFRMAILGKVLEPIETFLKAPSKKRRPVIDLFLST